jgi:hypothetical protein
MQKLWEPNLNRMSLMAVFDTGGKPSTWFPPKGLVEHMFVTNNMFTHKSHTWGHKHVHVHMNQCERAHTSSHTYDYGKKMLEQIEE